MKFLFLDVDGVLNTHDYRPETQCGQIHADKIARLNSILTTTGAYIVLSSAWRYIVHRRESTIQGMEWLFRSHGLIAGRIVGVTRPDTMIPHAYDGKVYHGGKEGFRPMEDERGKQIQDFLNDYGPFETYVVLDDLDIGIRAAGHPFVQTDGKVGLMDEHVNEAVLLLCAKG